MEKSLQDFFWGGDDKLSFALFVSYFKKKKKREMDVP